VSQRRIGIIGAGAGGIGAAIQLLRAGYDDLTILEKAGGVGGTWWHNRYPGLSCDVQSHLYSYSFAPKLDWSRPYASGSEIQAYLEQVAADHGVRSRIRLDTEVASARWDAERAEWTLSSAAGERFVFDVVVASLGMFNLLNLPDIEGLDGFEGRVFHSARWDAQHDLRGRRVAVIGSAASAVQLVPEVAKVARQLHVFQRAANWVLPKADTPWTPEQLAGFRASPELVARLRSETFAQVDASITFSNPEVLAGATEAGLRAIAVVEDPELRRRLTPATPYGCQRPLISNDYYVTFNRPNVELVTDPIRRIGARAIVTADGTERPVDTLVLATGFKTAAFLSAIDVVGRGGTPLREAWRDGPHAYLGITTAGFPNLFMLYGPNTNNGSILYMLECQAAYVTQVLRWMDGDGVAWADVRPEVEARYNERLQRDLDGIGVWSAGRCHNYYRDASGRIVTQWPHSMTEYRRRTEHVQPGDFAVGRR
jgi:cation diffusion facilitator CzcD-associated flavoprotein CzcO